MAMNELDKETVIALAKNNMNTTDTANQLGVHRNTVLYRYDRMKNRTGLDPRNFYDLHKLVNMATGKDIVEVVHGRWERINEGVYLKVRCTACGVDAVKVNTSVFDASGLLVEWAYCPTCGAKMDGDGNA